MRIDRLLVERGLVPNRELARRLVMAGEVLVGDRPVTKPGAEVADDSELRLRTPASPYASRGGEKLAGALDVFGIDVSGLLALDVGASTGGFTSATMAPPGRTQAATAGSTFASEMNDTSTVARSAGSGSWLGSRCRAFVRSTTVTRASCCSFHASCP